MKVSVVLSTYNGEKYIKDLLKSLKEQEKVPDEVLIFDDCSTDNTVKIIKDFILQWNLLNWKVFINKHNLGWMENFYQGILKATGDVIFPCDQDDIWNKTKISHMTEIMERNKNILLLCCDYNLIYMNGANSYEKSRISKVSNKKNLEFISFNKGFLYVDRPGCTYCIRKELVPIMKNMHFQGYPHDALAWRSAALNDGLFIIHEKLIDFRRHSNNASTSNKILSEKGAINTRLEAAIYYLNVLNKAISCENDKAKLKKLKKWKSACCHRVDYLKKRSISSCIKSIINIKYYPRATSYFGDVLSLIKKY